MADKFPYFRWWPADAEMDPEYSAMTDEQVGFYHHCLNLSWINDGIPADPAARARLLKRNRNQADARWAGVVASRWIPHQYKPGYLVNARQEAERAHAESKRVKATESANLRYGRSANEPANAPRHARTRAGSGSGSGSEETRARDPENRVSRPQPADGLGEAVERIYAAHPKKTNLPLVFDALRDAVLRKPLAEIEAVHRAWCASESWKEKAGQFVPQLARWLADRGYDVWPNGSRPQERNVYIPLKKE